RTWPAHHRKRSEVEMAKAEKHQAAQVRQYEVDVTRRREVVFEDNATITVEASSVEEAKELAVEIAADDFDVVWDHHEQDHSTHYAKVAEVGLIPTEEEEAAMEAQQEQERLTATINKLRQLGYTVAASDPLTTTTKGEVRGTALGPAKHKSN